MFSSEFYFILKPSSLGGIGVFSVTDLPKNTIIFTSDFSPKIRLIKEVPEPFLKYCIYIDDKQCLSPERFDRMEMGWYINHSPNPNVIHDIPVTDITFDRPKLIAVNDIKVGDEILINYNQLNEPEHLKEAYYRK